MNDRSSYIGGSFVAKFLTASEPADRFYLLLRQIAESLSLVPPLFINNSDIQRGVALEPVVFREFILPKYPSAVHFLDDTPPILSDDFLGGHIDAYDEETKTLFEIKCPRYVQMPPRAEWIVQTTFYAALLERSSRAADNAFIVQFDYIAFDCDFSRVDVSKEKKDLVYDKAKRIAQVFAKYQNVNVKSIDALLKKMRVDPDVKELVGGDFSVGILDDSVVADFERVDKLFRYAVRLRRQYLDIMKNSLYYSSTNIYSPNY